MQRTTYTSYGHTVLPQTRTTTVVERSPVRDYTRTTEFADGSRMVTTRSPGRFYGEEVSTSVYERPAGVTTTTTTGPGVLGSSVTRTTSYGGLAEERVVTSTGLGLGSTVTRVTRSPSRYLPATTTTYTATGLPVGEEVVTETTYGARPARRSITRTVGPLGHVTTSEVVTPGVGLGGSRVVTRYY